jgi:ubiquinone/menaquinone biosynthesis C-methylase UbiE
MADFDEFKMAEKSGWEAQGNVYHLGADNFTAGAASTLLEMAKVGSGDEVAIIACGPGYGMDLASDLGAKPLGIDFSESMLTTARQKYPGHKFEQGDAENLVHESNSFDAIVCPFGVLHFAYPNKALSEFFRVLKPGGRMVYSVWTSLEQNPFFNMAMSTIAKHGTLDVAMPPGPQMFGYADGSRAKRELTDIGFIDIKVNALPLIGRSDDPQFLVDSLKHSTVRTKMALDAQTPEALEAIFLDLRHQTNALKTPDGDYALDFHATAVSASTPKT